jgi:hypothetical protein
LTVPSALTVTVSADNTSTGLLLYIQIVEGEFDIRISLDMQAVSSKCFYIATPAISEEEDIST